MRLSGGALGKVARAPYTTPLKGSRHESAQPDPEIISIAACLAPVLVRTLPWHWESDLIMGRNNQTALGTSNALRVWCCSCAYCAFSRRSAASYMTPPAREANLLALG
jgi:hypothetical protein